MINLPTDMLKRCAEEGSPLPEAVIFHNLVELAAKEETLEVNEKGFKGMLTIPKEILK